MMNIGFFFGAMIIMWKYGKTMSDSVENQIPTEKKMMELMREMQAQQMMGGM